MKRPCATPSCQRPATKAVCGCRVCDACLEAGHAKTCPLTRKLLSVDPKQWQRENAPETALTTQVIDALNASGWVHAFRVDSGGARQRGGRMAEPGTPDVVAYAVEDAIFCGVETKRTHPDLCACPNCTEQRAWGARLVRSNGVYVHARKLQEALDGVRMGLARARARGAA